MYFEDGKIISEEWVRAPKTSFSKANKQKGERWSASYAARLLVFVLFLFLIFN